MGRSPCCSKEGLNRGVWTANEDKILKEYIKVHGEGRWRNFPQKAGLKRCGKSCRLRWLNYLRPDIKRGNISSDEEELIIRLHKLLGNRWSLIAGRLPGRTDNEIKNYWKTKLGKKHKDGNQKSRNSSLRNNTLNPMPQLAPVATRLTPKLDSNVIRTKATKCSKVSVLNPLPDPTVQLIPNKFKVEAVVEAKAEEAVDAVACNSLICNQMESMTNDNEFLLYPGEEKELPNDFLMDFKVDDFFLFDLLNSDISNPEQLQPCSGQVYPMPSAEVLMDCT